MKARWRRAVLGLGTVGLITTMAAGARLTLLHTNDTHGHLLPFSYPEGTTGNSNLDQLSVRRDLGGAARRSTLVHRIRSECAERGVPVRLLDAGDFCDGTPLSTEYQGEADIAAMNSIGVDGATFGNHEYNQSLQQVRRLASLANYPILCANVMVKATGRPLLQPYRIETIDSLRFGFFGLTTEESQSYPGARDSLLVLSPLTTAHALADTLRARGADVIVLISHCGERIDRQIADEVPGISVIVGGHSHSRLPSGEFFKPFPDSVADPGGTIVVQAHQWGGELGRLDLEFRRDPQGRWEMVRHDAQLIPVTAEIPADSATEQAIDRFWNPIAQRYGQVLGTAEGDFMSRGPDRAEYNLVADAIRETFQTEIELENLGGVRAPLVRGPITLSDLVTLDPFSNTVVTFRITGRRLREILQQHQPAVSGLTYRLENGSLTEVRVGGEPLQDDHTYTGSSNSYFAGRALQGIDLVDTGRPRLEVIRDYVQKKGKLQPVYDGRRVVTGG